MLGLQLARGAMTVTAPMWIICSGRARETPFMVGVYRALTVAFPLVMNDDMPARMKLALEALVALAPVGVADQPRDALGKTKLTVAGGTASTPSVV
jgi:hypothetical protein